MTKPKIVFLSDSPLTVTGFATATKDLANGLSNDYEVHFLGHNYLGQTLKPGTTLEDGEQLNFWLHGTGRMPYAQDMILPLIRELKPEFFIVYLDTFMLYPWSLFMDFSPARTIFWYLSDGEGGLPLGCEHILKKFNHPVAVTRFAQNQAKQLYNIDSERIPNGVHTTTYYPLPDKKAVKQKMGIRTDKFVVGTVARNQPRKMMDRTIKAFAEFAKNKNDVLLYAHTDPEDQAQVSNLIELIKRYNIGHKVVFSGMKYYKGFTLKQMNDVYNAMDVFMLSCFHPNTPITTLDGFKRIEDVHIGDEVLTIDGSFQKVEDKVSYYYDEELLCVQTAYNPDVLVTPNHFVYGVHSKNLSSYQKHKTKNNPKLELKPIEEFKVGDFLVVPRMKEVKNKEFIIFDNSYISNQFGKTQRVHPRAKNLTNVRIDNDFMWLCGMYLAEGCLSQKCEKPEGIVFCINSEEKIYTERILQIMKEKFGIEGRVHDDTRHRRTIWFNSSSLGRKLKELFGSGAKNKKIPEWMLYLDCVKQQCLIDGYLAGDGNLRTEKNSKLWTADTVSMQLAHHLRIMLIRLGYLVSYHTKKRQSLVHRIRFTIEGKNRIGFMDENYFYTRINKITKQKYAGQVHDLSINKNHNYCTYWLGKNTSGEGFGIPIIEAAACAVPSVITDYTTTKELLIEDGVCGFPVRVNDEITGTWNVERAVMDIKDCVRCLNELYTSPELRTRMGEAGRKKAEEVYAWPKIIQQWKVLLRKLLSA